MKKPTALQLQAMRFYADKWDYIFNGWSKPFAYKTGDGYSVAYRIDGTYFGIDHIFAPGTDGAYSAKDIGEDMAEFHTKEARSLINSIKNIPYEQWDRLYFLEDDEIEYLQKSRR